MMLALGIRHQVHQMMLTSMKEIYLCVLMSWHDERVREQSNIHSLVFAWNLRPHGWTSANDINIQCNPMRRTCWCPLQAQLGTKPRTTLDSTREGWALQHLLSMSSCTRLWPARPRRSRSWRVQRGQKGARASREGWIGASRLIWRRSRRNRREAKEALDQITSLGLCGPRWCQGTNRRPTMGDTIRTWDPTPSMQFTPRLVWQLIFFTHTQFHGLEEEKTLEYQKKLTGKKSMSLLPRCTLRARSWSGTGNCRPHLLPAVARRATPQRWDPSLYLLPLNDIWWLGGQKLPEQAGESALPWGK